MLSPISTFCYSLFVKRIIAIEAQLYFFGLGRTIETTAQGFLLRHPYNIKVKYFKRIMI